MSKLKKPAKTTRKRTKSPPDDGLSDSSRKWMKSVIDGYELKSHHMEILRCAAEAKTRMQQSQEILSKDGLTFTDQRGQVRVHPCVLIERDSRIAFLRSLRELGLDLQTADTRPPYITSNRYANDD